MCPVRSVTYVLGSSFSIKQLQSSVGAFGSGPNGWDVKRKSVVRKLLKGEFFWSTCPESKSAVIKMSYIYTRFVSGSLESSGACNGHVNRRHLMLDDSPIGLSSIPQARTGVTLSSLRTIGARRI